MKFVTGCDKPTENYDQRSTFSNYDPIDTLSSMELFSAFQRKSFGFTA